MAPPLGPPPYTMDQINAMSTKAEQKRALAELSSYVARMKKEQRDEELARETHTQTRDYNGSYGSGSGRGGYSYNGRGRGAHQYHPYGRPQYAPGAAKFSHRTVVFSKPDASTPPTRISTPDSDYHRDTSRIQRPQHTEPKTLCRTFTSTGVCSRHGCTYLHDPTKQALCKPWLYKDNCTKGRYCGLSHKPSPNNAPTCLHFQEGRCNNEDCRFAHVGLNPAALNCDAFGRLGYCEKGADCAEVHAYECPDFANKGECRYGDKCQLRHVHRASRMRQPSRSPSVERSFVSDRAGETRPKNKIIDLTREYDLAEDLTAMLSDHDEATPKSQEFTEQLDYVPLGD